MSKTLPGAALAGIATLGLFGCKDVRIATGADDAFLHYPDALNATPPPPTKALFPLKPGSRWTYRLMGQKEYTEQVTLLPPRIVDGRTVQVFRSQRPGVPAREELYQVSEKEILQVAAGATDVVQLKPPMPLLRFPLRFDDVLTWQGGTLLKGSQIPSQGRSRLRSTERITVAAGTFDTYRLDSILSTSFANGTVRFWTTRWLAPGIGPVRVRYVVITRSNGEKVFSKELVSYKI